jgi:hypothetical protein
MSEINVQLKEGASAVLPAPVTVAEALKRLDRDAAKQALAAKVNGREVDLAFTRRRTCSPPPSLISFPAQSSASARRFWTMRATDSFTMSSRRSL